jgi:hypothetical protein
VKLKIFGDEAVVSYLGSHLRSLPDTSHKGHRSQGTGQQFHVPSGN